MIDTSAPDMTGWSDLDSQTVRELRRAWECGDRTIFRVLERQALATASARKRSIEHADRRRADQFKAAAVSQGVNADSFFDLTDLPPATRERLTTLRQHSGLVEYATALGLERLARAEAAEAASKQTSHATRNT